MAVALDLAAQPEARQLASLHARTVHRRRKCARDFRGERRPQRDEAGNASSQLSAIGSFVESVTIHMAPVSAS